MINDMDTQQIYGIMSMEDIEQMFSQIERRIGVHEHKVSALEQRWIDFNQWYVEGSLMPGEVGRSCADEVGRAYLARLEMEQKQQQAEAPKVISGETGGEDDPV
jgi:hypothetical protein